MTMTDVSLALNNIHDVEYCRDCNRWSFSYGDLDSSSTYGQVLMVIGDNSLLAEALELDSRFEAAPCAWCRAKAARG